MHLILIAGLNDKIASRIVNHLRDSVGNTYFIAMNRRIGSKQILIVILIIQLMNWLIIHSIKMQIHLGWL